MVHRTPKSSKTVVVLLIVMLTCLITFSLIKTILTTKQDNNEINKNLEEQQEEQQENQGVSTKPHEIDLQGTVNQWISSVGNNNAGVYIFDLDNNAEVGSHNGNRKFFTGSIYKLFFVYEAYLRISQGIVDGDEYFADGKTRLECLDLMIRESYNPCADQLRKEMADEIDDIISDKFKISDTESGGLYASAKAIGDMLKIYYNHTELSEDLWIKIADSMLNQPTTTYNWRQGLPSGFTVARVYNKVGWNSEDGIKWTNYNDAAMVEFPEQKRHYIVVVLTTNTSNTKVAELGRLIEEAVVNYN